MLVVVPLELDACEEVAFLIDRHFVVVEKCFKEVVGLAFADVLDAKIVHY